MDSVLSLINERPTAAEAIHPARQSSAFRINDFVYMSSGTSNSYMVVTEEGRVIINTGMGFESLVHKRVFDEVCPGPTPYILLTQGHVDHVGGVKTFREPNTRLIAQSSLSECQADDERIHDRRSAQSYIWFSDIIDDAMTLMDQHPELFEQDHPVADISFDDHYAFSLGGVDFELISVPGGETIDSCVVWLPRHRILFSGNVFGPLFPHFPNFNTIRGDKYRDVGRYLESLKTIQGLQPSLLITGHGEPVRGEGLIQKCLTRLHDAVDYVHRETLAGIAEGKGIHHLMREITLPPELKVGQGYGRVAWCVRTIWEQYMGWFLAERTSELYPTPVSELYPDIVRLTGVPALLELGKTRLQGGELESALMLAEMLLKAEPEDPKVLALCLEVHEKLLEMPEDADNFWLGGWLRYQVADLKSRLEEVESREDFSTSGDMDPEAVFSKLSSLFIPAAAENVDTVLLFNITGCSPEGGKGNMWHLGIHGAALTVKRGGHDRPDCTITMDGEDFVRLFCGKLNPIKALMLGKLKVEGDRRQARVLDSCFRKLDAPVSSKPLKAEGASRESNGEKPRLDKPRDIIFDDLASPRRTLLQKLALRASGSGLGEMTLEGVLRAARAQTGLSDFGEEGFKERLQLLLDEYNGDRGLTGLGRNQLYNDTVRYASNRLLIQDKMKSTPGLSEEKLELPLIVAGLPRSGTTHLVNLLASDQRFASLPLWLSQEPFHIKGKDRAGFALKSAAKLMAMLTGSEHRSNSDPRYLRSSLRWSAMQLMAPAIAAMHPMNPDHIHEELELMAPDFASYHFEWTSCVPRYRDHYLNNSQLPHYHYMKNVLKLLQMERNESKPWVLKCPQHMEQLPVLKETFPDASLVVTHRDPVAVIQSAATMVTYPQRMMRRDINPKAVIEYWTDRVEALLRTCVEERTTWNQQQSMDVLFHEFMAGDMATIARIYEMAEIELTPTARRQMSDFIKAHPRGKHGRVVYNLKENFGVASEEIRERFDFYYNAYPVKAEV